MLRRTTMKPSAPLKRTVFARGERKEASAVAKLRNVKPTRKAKSTAAERAHLAAVAALGCILCQHLGFGPTPAEVHHVRVNHGWGRSGHFNTIGLCPFHHAGQPGGVHSMGRDEFTARYGISELDLLQVVRIRLGLDFVKPKSETANGLQPIAVSEQNHR